jgi:hypothetical protein
MKSTLAEAMALAQKSSSSPSEATSCTPSVCSSKRHSYSRIKQLRRTKGTAVRTMNSSAMVSSLMLEGESEPSVITDAITEIRSGRATSIDFKGTVWQNHCNRQRRIIVRNKIVKCGETCLKVRKRRRTRRRRRRGMSGPKRPSVLYASRYSKPYTLHREDRYYCYAIIHAPNRNPELH